MSRKWECERPGCNRKSYVRGLCPTHYRRWRLGLDMDAPVKKRGNPLSKTCKQICNGKRCGKPTVAHNLCAAHYARVHRGAKVAAETPVRSYRHRAAA